MSFLVLLSAALTGVVAFLVAGLTALAVGFATGLASAVGLVSSLLSEESSELLSSFLAAALGAALVVAGALTTGFFASSLSLLSFVRAIFFLICSGLRSSFGSCRILGSFWEEQVFHLYYCCCHRKIRLLPSLLEREQPWQE